MNGDEPEVIGENIIVDDHGAFTVFANDSESDNSITNEYEDTAASV